MSLIVRRHGDLKGPFLFYRGTQWVWFSEEEWTYYRVTPAGLVPLEGVTNTLRVVDKSNFLLPWGVRKAFKAPNKTSIVRAVRTPTGLAARPIAGRLSLADNLLSSQIPAGCLLTCPRWRSIIRINLVEPAALNTLLKRPTSALPG